MLACGGAPPSQAPGVQSDRETKTVEPGKSIALSTNDFEQAEDELQAAFSGDGATSVGPAEPSTDPSRPLLDPKARPTNGDDGEEIFALDKQNRCSVACKAFASMKRSADNVCEMTSEDDERCEGLRDRVERARRVVKASCPACDAAR